MLFYINYSIITIIIIIISFSYYYITLQAVRFFTFHLFNEFSIYTMFVRDICCRCRRRSIIIIIIIVIIIIVIYFHSYKSGYETKWQFKKKMQPRNSEQNE